MKVTNVPMRGRLATGAAVLAITMASQMGFAQSREAYAYEGANNMGTQMYLFDADGTAGSPAFASTDVSFTGMDGFGATQTMRFQGSTAASAEYGQLHCATFGTLTNSYYNSANSPFVAADGSLADPNGSPDTMNSLGFAIFTDTLHFGGNLQSGYRARYLFHVDGTNAGVGALADLSVDVDSNQNNSFFAFDTGSIDTTWATDAFDVNGISPQQIRVQFSTQVVFNTFELTDGGNYSGMSDFSSTVTLAGIEMFDANGNTVTGWTVTSDSGTQYNTVPEPATLTAFLGLAVPAFLRRRKKNS